MFLSISLNSVYSRTAIFAIVQVLFFSFNLYLYALYCIVPMGKHVANDEWLRFLNEAGSKFLESISCILGTMLPDRLVLQFSDD